MAGYGVGRQLRDDWPGDFLRECYPNVDVMTREELIVALSNELRDVRMLDSHCSQIYDYATGCRVSKSQTLPRVVMGLIDDHVTELCETAVADARDEWEAENARPANS